MAERQLSRILQGAWRAIRLQAGGDAGDGILLERFAQFQDEAAFETLLRRHGPMILGVCRRVLGNTHEIDDVFQATFLVLIAKAGTLDPNGSLAGWLYTVAFHLALKARARAGRRQAQEKPSLDMDMYAAPEPELPSELGAVLDEELSRLPEKYRVPLILCYLQGKSNAEAAEQLGCAVGTVWGRLSRGRDLLRDQLARRGVAVPAAGLAHLLSQETATAAVPASLLTGTKQLALLMVASKTAEVAAGPAALLAADMLRSMWLGKLKVAMIAVCLVGLGAAGATWLHHRPVAPSLATPTVASRPPVLPEPLNLPTQAAVAELIKPQAGEVPWLRVPWLLSLWEARRQAAAQGKPIFLWSTAGAAPLGACEGNARESRASGLWDDASIAALRDQFVAVAVDGRHLIARQDDEGRFVRDHGIKIPPWGSGFIVITAAGKVLRGPGSNLEQVLKNGWAAWQELPPAERAAGAVAVGEPGPADPDRLNPDPPAGGLILKHYYRLLAREPDGQLRLSRHEDFPLRPQPAKSYLLEAQPDFLWLTESEWRALVPAAPRTGQRVPVPAVIQERIFRYHLNPVLAVSETSNSFTPGQIRAGELVLTVAEVTGTVLRLRLDGYALLGRAFDPALDGEGEGALESGFGYEPRLTGTWIYDRVAGRWSQIEIVALGDVYGTPGSPSDLIYRPGRQPLGVFFELVQGAEPADRVPPRSYRSCNKLNGRYFSPTRKAKPN